MTETTIDAPPADLDLLATVAELAQHAGLLVAELFHGDRRRASAIAEDGRSTVDHVVEDAVRGRIRALAPQDGILGARDRADVAAPGRRWLIDPLDGMPFFSGGIPLFTSALTCRDEHGILAAALVMPMQQELLYAGRGRGALLLAGERFTPETAVPARITRNSTATQQRVLWPEDIGGVPYKTALLATGRADAVVIAAPPSAHWWAPLPMLVREAGGCIADAEGRETGRGTLLACASDRHPELRASLLGAHAG
ncbi:inositol monophosphatase family protein [Actinoalloteichus hymeniacidonis]|uniref:Inositol monophosphatase/fructose-1,6-bisphosphatase family protein n=1 Tax=Actinoalloteichus hymeniacidonis TaxID=340345 RepID=A0AAC9MWP7_9PSEU|nr:inositol monophosphatase family protein [Actinoalloteichus hymeniacidonis]AOS61349.1 inositol monophosphatase/fructose-1,6-bisphosphatase family protein [Actinoalloteichus hymeniacidonis]MBB5910646.1 histidinol-phosphatase [Actinoalloteichus hymeniacidonis]